MKWTSSDVCSAFGIDRRTLTNWLNEQVPVPSEKGGRDRSFDSTAVVEWYAARAVRRAEQNWEKRSDGDDLAAVRRRRLEAETQEVEIRVSKMLAEVLPLEVVETTVGRVCDRLLPALQNIPANYGLRLEELGIPAAKAEAVLEDIATSLTTTLRDAVEADEDESEEEAGDDVSDVA